MILGTNVVPELMRPGPNPAVLSRVGGLPLGALRTTSAAQAEILYGIALLPAGKRRDALAAAADTVFAEDFAERFAAVVAARRQAGNPVGDFDARMAAIALAAGAAVPTRDTGGFAGCGLAVVDPWRTA